MTERKYHVRLFIAAGIFSVCFICLIIRLLCLHLGPHDDMRLRLKAKSLLEKDLDFRRGEILDCNGNILALDIVKKELCADPSIIVSNNNVQVISSFIGKELGLDPVILARRIERPESRFAFLAGYGYTLDSEQALSIERMNFSGIYLNDILVRSYPRRASMCHVIGFVNLARTGSAGIEQRFDKYLRGVPGLLLSKKDGKQNELYDERRLNVRPHKGASVKLTLDQNVQFIVERAIANAREQQNAVAAWAVVERVKTGEILAMASNPAFDLADFRHTASEQLRNRCIANVYEPGSTFKIVVISAALNESVIKPLDVIDCERGRWVYANRPLRDYHSYDKLTVADVIKKSSNIGAAKIALLLGNSKLYTYLKAYGIGEVTGIELPGEEAGILRPVSKWSSLSPTRIAIGHEVAVTALQMLGVMCAIANGGVLMKPYVVKELISNDGKVFFAQKPLAISCPIRPDTAAIMMKLLRRVTEQGGTGRRACVDGYAVGGKTGTAQKWVGGSYSSKLNIASFVGFLPAENPEVGIIVVVDEPKKRFHTGGMVAGPVFREIAEQVVKYMDIAPVKDDAI